MQGNIPICSRTSNSCGLPAEKTLKFYCICSTPLPGTLLVFQVPWWSCLHSSHWLCRGRVPEWNWAQSTVNQSEQQPHLSQLKDKWCIWIPWEAWKHSPAPDAIQKAEHARNGETPSGQYWGGQPLHPKSLKGHFQNCGLTISENHGENQYIPKESCRTTF